MASARRRPATVRGMRALALWAVLFAAYAATVGIDTTGTRHYGDAEARQLLVAESIVSDRDVDLTDEFATREYRRFHTGRLRPQGEVILGRTVEPQGVGFPALIAPAYALGGARGVELFLPALAALGFVLAARIARRIVPEPWASGGALLAGLSPPALAHATAVHPEAVAGTALAGAAPPPPRGGGGAPPPRAPPGGGPAGAPPPAGAGDPPPAAPRGGAPPR